MSQSELEAFRRVVDEIAELAHHASLTGSLSGGEKRVVERYNAVLAKATEMGGITDGIFLPLPANSNYGEIGVEARMLSAQLAPSKMEERRDPSILVRLAPFIESEELSMLVRDQLRDNQNFDMNTLTHLAPFMESSMLSELIRKHLHEPAAAPEPQPAPAPQPAPQPWSPPAPQPAPTVHPVATPASEQPEDVLALLKNPHLTEWERAELMTRLENLVNPRA